MTYICPLCKLIPSSHSLTKVLEKKGIIYYYTCPSQAILYYDVNGIVNHYDGVLSEIPENQEWIWIFDSLGFSLIHAMQINVAIELAKLHKPDLAILDVKMPEVDGITAAEQIISISPVLMLTAFSQRELIERARDAGVMAYVVKPFSINDLVPAIEIAISRHKQMKSLEAEVADIYERLESRKVIDRAKGILMNALNLSEPEAFTWIQKTAMDRRISMREVAAAVIDPQLAPDK